MATDTTSVWGQMRLRSTVVAGAGASTNIAVTGITTADALIGVFEVVDPASAATPAVIDRNATTSITSAGNIQCTAATNTTANHRLIVWWMDVDG